VVASLPTRTRPAAPDRSRPIGGRLSSHHQKDFGQMTPELEKNPQKTRNRHNPAILAAY
jgi:hypothetical protein